MTWKISVISAGIEYNLSDHLNYLLTAIDGLGMASVRRITERGPLQHGVSDRGYRLESRIVPMKFFAKGGETDVDVQAWLDRRAELLKIFRSNDDPVKLKFSYGSSFVRQLDCFYSGELKMKPGIGFEPRWQEVILELFAPDPTWYDPTEQLISVGGGGGTGFAVATPVPSNVGSSDLDATVAVSYPGSWDSFPTIKVTGPITAFKIENVPLGEKLQIKSGVTIGSGVTYEIDCRYGKKTVKRLSDGANRLQDLTDDSHLATFRIAAHPKVSNGDNSLKITGTSIDSNTKIEVRYLRRYIGV